MCVFDLATSPSLLFEKRIYMTILLNPSVVTCITSKSCLSSIRDQMALSSILPPLGFLCPGHENKILKQFPCSVPTNETISVCK